MRKTLCLLLAVLCLCLTACAGENLPAEDIQPPAEEEPAGPAYWFTTSETSDRYSDEEGNLLASYDYQILVMETREDADEALRQAAEAFNAGMREILDSQLEVGQELSQWASFDERLSGSLGDGGYYYVDELTAEGLQTGDIYSVSLYNYSYMGGVHPNETYFSRTFDLSRGAYIDPLEVADDPELFRATVTDLLLDHIQHLGAEVLAGYFKGYEETVAQWNTRSVRFGQEGMTVTFSQYELGPYAMGTQSFEIQYEEFAEALGQGGQVKLGLIAPEAAESSQGAA